MIRRVAVYCGSSLGLGEAFARHAVEVGHEIVQRGMELVYGGGKVGLMGIVADTVLSAGGVVTGVITNALLAAEVGHSGLARLDVVETMHERKARMAELADAFVALPGGFGTFDELVEVILWTQLGLHAKPAVVVNTNGFYDALLRQVQVASTAGFMKPVHAGLLRVGSDPREAFDKLVDPIPLPVPKWVNPPDGSSSVR